MAYLDLRVFLSIHTCGLTSLEPNLTAVAWRAKKLEQWHWSPLNFFNGSHGIAVFYSGSQRIFSNFFKISHYIDFLDTCLEH